jgi:hypothetical protein
VLTWTPEKKTGELEIEMALESQASGKRSFTAMPSGKQRSKKSGRGIPTMFFMESVKSAVKVTAVARPAKEINEPHGVMYPFLQISGNMCFS